MGWGGRGHGTSKGRRGAIRHVNTLTLFRGKSVELQMASGGRYYHEALHAVQCSGI